MTLEKLLNILCEKGWKPRGIDQKFGIWIETSPYKKIRVCLKKPDYDYYVYSYRELVSKESGLWQFVCENEMVKNANDYSWELYNGEHGQYEVYKNGYEGGKRWEQVDYEYRIIQSALCDEDKLEDFLLSNINVEGEK